MIKITCKGNFSKANSHFEKLREVARIGILDKYGRRGVELLSQMTPKDTGKTASSWSYGIVHTKEGSRLDFYNSNINKGVNIAIILQYGHATGTHGYVKGIDYINPAMRPLFEEFKDDLWKEVTQV